MIRHATAADAEFCAGILTAAFADDPVSRWLVADPADNLRVHHRGLGSALLVHRLANLDPMGKPTYLVATTRRSATGVYARAGYRPLGEPIQFPKGLQVYPLWRDPPPMPEAG